MRIVVLENLAFGAEHFVSGGLIRWDPRDSTQTMKDTVENKEPDVLGWPVILQVFLMESPGGSSNVNITLDKSQPMHRSALQRYTVAGNTTEETVGLYLSLLEQLGCNAKYMPTREKVWQFLGGKPSKPQDGLKIVTKQTGRDDFLAKAQGGDSGNKDSDKREQE